MKKFIIIPIILISMLTALGAKVSISTVSHQLVIKKDKSGKNVKRWEKTTKVTPGTIIRYTNSIKNSGSSKAEDLVIINAIPKHMQYIKGSAKCKSRCTVSYSVNGGKSYASAKKLYVKGKQAKASQYTHIRWVVAKLSGGKKDTVEYRAKLN
jgi:uncharacterized repeat protein (TIGR01451 family)